MTTLDDHLSTQRRKEHERHLEKCEATAKDIVSKYISGLYTGEYSTDKPHRVNIMEDVFPHSETSGYQFEAIDAKDLLYIERLLQHQFTEQLSQSGFSSKDKLYLSGSYGIWGRELPPYFITVNKKPRWFSRLREGTKITLAALLFSAMIIPIPFVLIFIVIMYGP